AGNAGPIADLTTIKECRAKLSDLDQDREEALANNDLGAIEPIDEQIEFIKGYLSAALGPRGRQRNAPGARDGVRKAVRRAIVRAINQIKQHHADWGIHLEQSVRTGFTCRYRPSSPTKWLV